jgi:hypothetical protein
MKTKRRTLVVIGGSGKRISMSDMREPANPSGLGPEEAWGSTTISDHKD